MVNALLSLLRSLFSVWLFETAGAALLVFAAWDAWGHEAGAAVAGVALLLKSLDLDLRRGHGEP